MDIERKIESLARRPEQKREIPLEWFVGNGTKDSGVNSVSFSTEFSLLGKGKVQKYMMDYGDIVSNKNSRDAESQMALAEYRRRIREATDGFSCEELKAKRRELERRYKGHQEVLAEAPIRLDLF